MLRIGHVVAQVNDVSALESTLSALHRCGPAQLAGAPVSEALSAHELVRRTAFRHLGGSSLGAAVAQPNRRGHSALSRRLRTWAKSRGALAHPDISLAEEIEEAVGSDPCRSDEVVDEVGPWVPAELADDRRLRGRSPLHSRSSKVVKPPSEAAPQGGGRDCPGADARLHDIVVQLQSALIAAAERDATLERQIDLVATNQFEDSRVLRSLADSREARWEASLLALGARVTALDDKFHQCFDPVEDDMYTTLSKDLDRLKAQVAHNGNTANDNMDAIGGEFDQVKTKFW